MFESVIKIELSCLDYNTLPKSQHQFRWNVVHSDFQPRRVATNLKDKLQFIQNKLMTDLTCNMPDRISCYLHGSLPMAYFQNFITFLYAITAISHITCTVP